MQPPRPAALVADDSVAVRRLVAAQLRHEGYDVREAADGWEAWEQIEETAPDLLIVDDVLPGLSGVELVQLLRARGTPPRIAFLVEYDAGLARAELAGLPEGCVIRKPFDLTELSRAVGAIVST
jgi:two-component system phosphate regulon response regulator PhoB